MGCGHSNQFFVVLLCPLTCSQAHVVIGSRVVLVGRSSYLLVVRAIGLRHGMLQLSRARGTAKSQATVVQKIQMIVYCCNNPWPSDELAGGHRAHRSDSAGSFRGQSFRKAATATLIGDSVPTSRHQMHVGTHTGGMPALLFDKSLPGEKASMALRFIDDAMEGRLLQRHRRGVSHQHGHPGP